MLGLSPVVCVLYFTPSYTHCTPILHPLYTHLQGEKEALSKAKGEVKVFQEIAFDDDNREKSHMLATQYRMDVQSSAYLLWKQACDLYASELQEIVLERVS